MKYDELVNNILNSTKECLDDSTILVIHSKSQYDYVSDIDIKFQEIICKHINILFPEDQIFSEETPSKFINETKPYWVLDPIDGTSNFIGGLPFWCISLAYVENNKIIYSLVIDLNRNDIYEAYKGKGVFVNKKEMKKNNVSTNLIGISTGTFDQISINDLRRYGKFRILGSQSLHLCYVALGILDACINIETKIWDDIAGILILEEAGGDYFSKYKYSSENISMKNIDKNVSSAAISIDNKDFSNLLDNIIKNL